MWCVCSVGVCVCTCECDMWRSGKCVVCVRLVCVRVVCVRVWAVCTHVWCVSVCTYMCVYVWIRVSVMCVWYVEECIVCGVCSVGVYVHMSAICGGV